MWFDDEDEGEDEEEQQSVQPASSSRQRREDLKDPDYQIPSRLQITARTSDDSMSKRSI